MDSLELLAEVKIQEALRDGTLDNLPGAGKPLAVDDLSRVPENLRMAYHVLRNANCLPEELTIHPRRVSIERLLVACNNHFNSIFGPSKPMESLRVLRIPPWILASARLALRSDGLKATTERMVTGH